MLEEKNINLILKQDDYEQDKPLLTMAVLVNQTKRLLLLWLVLAIVLGVAVGAMGLMGRRNPYKVRAIVEFAFEGIEDGKDPAGNEFDVTKLKAPAVIESALKEAQISKDDVSIESIRSNITLQGIVPEDAFEQMTAYQDLANSDNSSALKAVEALLDISYCPTQYIVTLNLTDTNLDKEQGVLVLDAILSAYKQYFYETYGYNQALGSAVMALDYNDYDYERAIEVLDTSLESAERYVSGLVTEDKSSFRSTETGYTFEDLLSALRTLRDEDLDWLSSYITVNNVTKDKTMLLTNYQYRIENLQRQKTEAETNLASIEASIAAYQKDTVLVTGSENMSDLEMSQASEQYDNMIERKLDTQETISNCIKNINYYESRVNTLKTTSSQTTEAQKKLLDEELAKLHTKITTLLEKINTTADEYYQNVAFANAYSVIVPAALTTNTESNNTMNDLLIVEAVLFVLVAMVVLVLALMAQYRLNHAVPEKTAEAVAATDAVTETKKAEPETTEPAKQAPAKQGKGK